MPRHEVYLVEGRPGTGKTTLGLQFLLAGVAAGERALFLTLSQGERALRRLAEARGWSLQGVEVHEVQPAPTEAPAAEQTVFPTAEVELGELMADILGAIRRVRPERVVIDTVAVIRLLAESRLRYRQEFLRLQRALTLVHAADDRARTTLLLDHSQSTASDDELEGLVDGVLALEQMPPDYGSVRRRLRVVKLRSSDFISGYHYFKINHSGVEAFPRLIPSKGDGHRGWETLESGMAELDAALGGGLEEGTTCILLGQTGTGKTSLSTLYAHAALQRGEGAALFLFDERPATFFARSEGLGMDLRPFAERGLLSVQHLNTAEISPGEFAQMVRQAVEEEVQAKVVLIDSLTGYLNAMANERMLMGQMHELLTYLSQRGVLSLLTVSQRGLVGSRADAPFDISYMADSVVLLRNFEAGGAIHRALSVVKKRHGPHEGVIRELVLAPGGIRVGPPLTEFSGVLTGDPVFDGNARRLLKKGDAHGADASSPHG